MTTPLELINLQEEKKPVNPDQGKDTPLGQLNLNQAQGNAAQPYAPKPYKFDGYITATKDLSSYDKHKFRGRLDSMASYHPTGLVKPAGDDALYSDYYNYVTNPRAWPKRGEVKGSSASVLAVDEYKLNLAKLNYYNRMVYERLKSKYKSTMPNVDAEIQAIKGKFKEEYQRALPHYRPDVANKEKDAIIEYLNQKKKAGKYNIYLDDNELKSLLGRNYEEAQYLRNKYNAAKNVAGTKEGGAQASEDTYWGLLNYYNTPDAEDIIAPHYENEETPFAYYSNKVSWDGKEFTVDDAIYSKDDANGWKQRQAFKRRMKPLP